MGIVVSSRRLIPEEVSWGLPPLLLALPLIVAASAGHTFAWEERLLAAIHRLDSPALANAAIWWSRLFHPQVVVVATVLLTLGFVLRRAWRQAVAAFASVIGALLLNTLLKRLVDRPRPTLWPALVVEANSGFPSGHAMTSCAFAALLVLLLWQTRRRVAALGVAIAWVALVALARLILGVHYPTDILAGWCLALPWVALVWWLAGARRPGGHHR